MHKNKSAYQAAGVDIESKMRALRAVKQYVGATRTTGVVNEIGAFGGMFKSPGRDHVLVSSADGVGTKLKVALMTGRHDTVGQDLVNHCVNDILVHGAAPLYFMDYFGVSGFDAVVFKAVMRGLCRACKVNKCALLGGETAEMPGLYPAGEYDLVGFIVGAAPKNKLITGKNIRAGDVLLGLPSSGLHTNGFSLARRIVFDQAGLRPEDVIPGVNRRAGAALLSVHRSYLVPVQALMRTIRVNGMAHITGGGFQDNVPRMLPDNLDAEIDCRAWRIPPLFRFLQEYGKVGVEEMFRVFNMGIGMVIAVRPRDVDRARHILADHGAAATVIGGVVKGARKAKLRYP